MNKYWFKPKSYGWGVFPVTWQGWLMTICLAALCFVACAISVPTKNWPRLVLDIIVLITLFMILAAPKTEGDIKWRWGRQ
jgi:hypothetical protein